MVIEDGLIRKVNTGDVKKLPDGRPVEGGDLMTTETLRILNYTLNGRSIRQEQRT